MEWQLIVWRSRSSSSVWWRRKQRKTTLEAVRLILVETINKTMKLLCVAFEAIHECIVPKLTWGQGCHQMYLMCVEWQKGSQRNAEDWMIVLRILLQWMILLIPLMRNQNFHHHKTPTHYYLNYSCYRINHNCIKNQWILDNQKIIFILWIVWII